MGRKIHSKSTMAGNRKRIREKHRDHEVTTRDTGSWFKNILHRALWLKGKGEARHKCSICADQNSIENWDHLWQCPKLKPTWDKFIQLANTTMGDHHTGHSQACIYLGVDGSGESIQGTLGLLHKLIWIFIIMDFSH